MQSAQAELDMLSTTLASNALDTGIRNSFRADEAETGSALFSEEDVEKEEQQSKAEEQEFVGHLVENIIAEDLQKEARRSRAEEQDFVGSLVEDIVQKEVRKSVVGAAPELDVDLLTDRSTFSTLDSPGKRAKNRKSVVSRMMGGSPLRLTLGKKVKRSAEEQRKLEQQIMDDEDEMIALIVEERASYRKVEEAQTAARKAEAAADEARKKSKALKLQLLNVREAQEAAAKKQQDLDVMKRRKDDLERYLANPPGFLDIEVAKAKRILDKKRSALSKQVDSFNSAIEQPNGVCSKAGVGAALQLVQLATTGVIDSTKFNWLQLRRSMLPATTELERLAKLMNRSWKRSAAGVWADEKVEKCLAPLRDQVRSSTEVLNEKLVQPTQVLYTTTIKPATKKAHVEALVVAEVVATDMAPKVVQAYGTAAPKVQSIWEKCMPKAKTNGEESNAGTSSLESLEA